jgi:ABC-2 type transport system permease protein
MSAVFKMTWVELKLLVREPFTLLFVGVFPIVVLLVLAGVFGNEPEAEWLGTTPANYYVAGYVGTVIAALSLVAIPVHLATYRERGILRRLTASSVKSDAVLASQMIVGLGLATIGSILLVIAAVAIYDIHAPTSLPGVVLAFIVGTLSFVALGILLGTIMPTARSAQAVGLALFFPMWMLSGTGPPPDVMTDVMQSISSVLPMTRLVSALQEPWIGSGTDFVELGILIAFLLVAGTIAVLRARAE